MAELLLRKEGEIKSEYGISFKGTAIVTGRHGSAVDPDGLDLREALRLAAAGESLSGLSKLPAGSISEVLRMSEADVMFENTPVNHTTGQPAIDHCKAALEIGMHVVTANKGTVVHGYRELTDLATVQGKRFFFESTVMDGAPIFSMFRSALPAARVESFRGVLNSTTNLILTRMEAGESFDEAVRYAQQIGIAETDPSADVDGWDAAIKVAALVTVLMGIEMKPQQVEREGIRGITAEMVQSAAEYDRRYRLICSAKRQGDSVTAWVAPELVSPSSPIYSVEGTTSIIEFKTDVLGNLSIVETDPGPRTTAYGLLADFLNAAA